MNSIPKGAERTRQVAKARVQIHVPRRAQVPVLNSSSPRESERKNRPPKTAATTAKLRALTLLRFANELRHQTRLEALDAFLGPVTAFLHAAKRRFRH